MWLLGRRTEDLLFSFFSWALSNSAIPSRRPRSRHSNRSSASSGLNITVRLLWYFQIVTISINLHSFTGSVTWSPSATSSPYPPPQRSSSDITIDSPCSIHGSEEDRFARSGREGGRGRLRSAAVSASAALAASPSSLSSSRGGRLVIVSLLYSWNDEQMMRRRRRSGKKKNH